MTNLRLLSLVGLLLAACDPPTDLGNPCILPNPDGGPGSWLATSSTDDFYYNGTAECQNLVCLRPAASPLDAGLGICSSPCTPDTPSDLNSSSEDCSGANPHLVCRSVALDPGLINQLVDAGGTQLLDKYLGGTTPPVFCTTPETINSSN